MHGSGERWMRASAVLGPLVAVWAVVVALAPWDWTPEAAGVSLIGGSVLLTTVLCIPLLLGWGHFQAHVALNAAFDARRRTRWRILLGAVPGATTVYWLRHVRRRRSA